MTHYFRLAVLILPLQPRRRSSLEEHARKHGKRDCAPESRYNPSSCSPFAAPDRHRTTLSDFTWPAYNNFSNPPSPAEPGLIPNRWRNRGGGEGPLKEEGRRLISTRCANLSAPPIFLADGSGEDSSFRFLFRSFSSLFSRIILKSSCSFPPSFHFSSSRFIVRGAMRKSFKSFQSSRHFLHSNLGDEAAQMIFAEILIFEDGEKS